MTHVVYGYIKTTLRAIELFGERIIFAGTVCILMPEDDALDDACLARLKKRCKLVSDDEAKRIFRRITGQTGAAYSR